MNHQFFLFSVAPPEPPLDLRVVDNTSNTITISWTYTIFIFDVTYKICYANAFDFETVCIPANPSIVNGRMVFTISGLVSDTSYFIDVQAINGVTDQDSKNDVQRVANTFGSTTEGGELFVKKVAEKVLVAT